MIAGYFRPYVFWNSPNRSVAASSLGEAVDREDEVHCQADGLIGTLAETQARLVELATA
jgi:hypothetical protein